LACGQDAVTAIGVGFNAQVIPMCRTGGATSLDWMLTDRRAYAFVSNDSVL
jgi:hypothetical protein